VSRTQTSASQEIWQLDCQISANKFGWEIALPWHFIPSAKVFADRFSSFDLTPGTTMIITRDQEAA